MTPPEQQPDLKRASDALADIPEQTVREFEIIVERNVQMVERLIDIMSRSPYTSRNDLVGVLNGLLMESQSSEKGVRSLGITAIIMLMLERQGRR